MIDSIGLGEAIAKLVYFSILAIAAIGSLIFLLFRRKIIALIWLSVFLNLFSILYFLGIRNPFVFLFNLFIWPILNIVLIVYYAKTSPKKK
jgi:hypothetical protein